MLTCSKNTIAQTTEYIRSKSIQLLKLVQSIQLLNLYNCSKVNLSEVTIYQITQELKSSKIVQLYNFHYYFKQTNLYIHDAIQQTNKNAAANSTNSMNLKNATRARNFVRTLS